MMSERKTSVAIIGGGISGLVCSARLSQLGITNTTVFDTGKRGPGGRCSSRYISIEGKLHTFDHAVQFFTVSDPRFAKIVSFMNSKKAIKVWTGKIVRVKSGEKPTELRNLQAFVGTCGMQSIPECLSSLTRVEEKTWVSVVRWDPLITKWKVDDHGWFDYLVVAHNGKCAAKLMAESGAPQIHNLLKVKFSPVLSPQSNIMHLCSLWVLIFAVPQRVGVDYDGAFVEHSDVSWIGNNSSKYDNYLECWTVISTKSFATLHKVPQEFIPPSKEKDVTRLLLNGFLEVTGINPKSFMPCFTKLQLWGAANPLNVLQEEECVFQSSHNVGICGDWLVSPCVEGAAISGLALAEVISKHVNGERRDVGLKKHLEPLVSDAIGAFPTNKSLFFNAAK